MQLRIQSEDIELDAKERETIEKRVRIMAGLRSNETRSVQIVLSKSDPLDDRVHCQMNVLFWDDARVAFDEVESDVEQAIQWALWRLNFALGRHSLRSPTRRAKGPLRSSN